MAQSLGSFVRFMAGFKRGCPMDAAEKRSKIKKGRYRFMIKKLNNKGIQNGRSSLKNGADAGLSKSILNGNEMY
jgi:hypothetical protein